MPEVHLDLGAMGVQRAQVDVLPNVHVRIPWRRLHAGGEAFDFHEYVLGTKNVAKQHLEVKPFPLGSANRTVVEIEAVDINDGAVRWDSHFVPTKSKGPQRRPRTQQPKPPG